MDKDYDAMALTIWAEVQQCPGSRPIEFSRRLRAAMEAEGMAVWIRPDHLYKARQAPYLCRVEPTQRMSDFVPLFTRPAPPAAPEQETCKQLLGAALRRLQDLGDTTFAFPAAPEQDARALATPVARYVLSEKEQTAISAALRRSPPVPAEMVMVSKELVKNAADVLEASLELWEADAQLWPTCDKVVKPLILALREALEPKP